MVIRKIATLCTIGITALACAITPVQAMEGGVEVSSDDQLAQMVIRVRHCTGTAIAPHWVLTARHCFPENAEKSYVRLGIERGTTGDQVAIDRFVEADKPLFIPNSDVALLHTIQDMKLPRYAELDYIPISPETRGTGYGWGKGTGNVLKKGELIVKTVGKSTYRGSAIEAYHTDNSNTQSGDSGGPLFVNEKVVGAASHKPWGYAYRWVNYSQLNGLEHEITQAKNSATFSETDRGPFQRRWNNDQWEDMESTDSSEFLDNTEEKTEQPPLLEVHTEDLLDSEGEGTKKPEADVNAHSPNLVEEKEESPTQKTTRIVGIVMGILAGLAGIGTLIAFLLQHMKIWG